MKRTSKILAVMLCVILSLCIPVNAKSQKTAEKKAAPTQTEAAAVRKATCTSSGKINISFKTDVVYDKTAAVVVKDAEGKELSASLTRKNKRLAVAAVKGLVKGQAYTAEISGIKSEGAAEFSTVTCSFKAKKIKTAIKASKPTVNKNMIIVKFKGKAAYGDVTVTVTDENNTQLPAKILKKTKSQIKIKADGLKKGSTYKVTVNGIKLKKEKNFGSVSGTFKVK